MVDINVGDDCLDWRNLSMVQKHATFDITQIAQEIKRLGGPQVGTVKY